MSGCISDARREVGVHDRVDLHGSVAHNCRPDHSQYGSQCGMAEVPSEAEHETGADQGRDLPTQLQCSTEYNAISHAVNQLQMERASSKERQPDSKRNRAQIEKYRC